MVAKSIHCVGKVQGVYFRATTKEVAVALKLCGWVKNQEDGSVLIHVEGQETAIDQLASWCHQGPQYAHVKTVEIKDSEIEGCKSFDIIR